MRRFRFVRYMLPSLILILAAIPVVTQTNTATLSGSVSDPQGASVPGVKITITNPATGLERTVMTDDSGAYIIPLLPPATYTLTAEREGFKRVLVENVVLNVGDQKSLRIELTIGQVDATVNVTGQEPLINDSAGVGNVIDRRFVGNLPLNGRSFQSLILLTPGVVLTTSDIGNPGQFSVNGQRANANYFTVDGVSANTGTYNTNGAVGATSLTQTEAGVAPGLTSFGGTNGLISIDALQEFRIQTSTYAAEYGRQSGGQISLVSRPGSNKFHGSLFDYFRNDVFDANDWFANAAGKGKAPLRQNMFGGTFSGPLLLKSRNDSDRVKNRTFFFVSYEGLRLRLPKAAVIQVPSLRVRQSASAAVKPLLNTFPLPTGPEIVDQFGQPQGTAPFTGVYSDPGTFDALSVRIDHTVNSKLALYGRFNYAPSETSTRNLSGLTQIDLNRITDKSITLGATSSFNANLSNEVKFNFDRSSSRISSSIDSFGDATPIDMGPAISPTFSAAFPNSLSIFAFNLNSGSGQVQAGPGDFVRQRQINLVDNFTFVHSAHEMKFGVDYRRLAPIKSEIDFQNVIFLDEAGLQSASPGLVQLVAFGGSKPIFTNFSVFGQDRWKATSRLTLEFGLRWDINPPPGEADARKPIVLTEVSDLRNAQLAPAGSRLYKTDYRGFAPRLGAVYQLSRARGWENVIRGGFGVFYDSGNGSAALGYYSFPFLLQSLPSGTTLPLSPAKSALPSPNIVFPITQPLFIVDPDLRLPYSLEWNVAFEQSLGADQTLSISYVASTSRRLITRLSLNRPPPGGSRANPNFSTINLVTNGPTADYQSMQVQFRRRLSKGFEALANYTWSHAIDEVSDEVSSGLLARGNSSFDVRHNFSAAASYDLPGKSLSGILGDIVGGWSIDAIVHAQTAAPIDISSGSFVRSDGVLITRRPNLILGVPLYIDDPSVPGGRRINAAAFQTPPAGRQGSLARNVLRGLPLFQIDSSIRRRFRLSEDMNLEFKVEAFNVFNHPNFGGLGRSTLVPATLGIPTQMLSRSIGGLSPIYQIGGPRSLQFSLRFAF